MPRTVLAAALALCALVLPVSIAATNVALGLLTAALLLRVRRDGSRIWEVWRHEPLAAALILYAAVGMLSALLSAAPGPSARDAVKDLHRLWALGAFCAAVALEPEAPVAPALILSFAVMAAVGVKQAMAGGLRNFAYNRAHGLVHPVVYGEQMAFAVLGGACLLLRARPRGARAAAAAFTALVFLAMALSETRMAVFAAFAGFALVCALEPRARRWMLAALLALAAAAAAWQVSPYQGRALSTVFQSGNIDGTSTRSALWGVAVRIFRDHPLTGAGPGGYRRLFDSYHPEAVDRQHAWGSAHNLYLHQLAERGLLGGAVLLLLCAVLLGRTVRAARRGDNTQALWAAGAVAAFLAMSLTETSFQNEQFGTLMMLVYAWGTGSEPSRGTW